LERISSDNYQQIAFWSLNSDQFVRHPVKLPDGVLFNVDDIKSLDVSGFLHRPVETSDELWMRKKLKLISKPSKLY
jgi:hypothetical protein